MGQRVVLMLDDQTHVDVPAWADLCEQTCAVMIVITFNQKLTTQKAKVIPHTQVISSQAPVQKLLAVGDVHGDFASMHKAWQYAQENHMHVIWLGDVIDYGDQNLKCLHLAYESVRNHQAHMIWGNHERKLTRWMDSDWGTHYRGRLSEANWKTIREIETLNPGRRRRLQAAWKCLESASYQVLQLGDWTFTHGAIHPQATGVTAHRLTGQAGDWAYFGQVLTPELNADGYPQRVWEWVNQLPDHARVVVGHDWIDRDQMTFVHKCGTQGAQVWCMDTGNSKGGRLSALEINLHTNKWEAKVFTP
jgi:protein phosphatase